MEILSLVSLGVSVVSCAAAVASVAVAWKVYRDQSSPDVIVYVDSLVEASFMAALFVRNIGSAPAYDVEIRTDGNILIADDCKEAAEDSFIRRGMPMLAPGSHRSICLGAFRQLAKEDAPCGEVVVSYRRRRGRGRRIEASFPVEALSFRATPVEVSIEAQRLGGIGKDLHRLTAEVKRIRNQMPSE